MDAITDEVAFESLPFFRIYKDGRIERLSGTEIVPPTTDPETGVRSKDVVVSSETGLSARLFLPKTTDTAGKLAFLLYIHGGAFCIDSPFSPTYHNYVASLAAEANVVALSVHYRRSPEHPLPVAYADAFEALLWAFSHSGGDGPEQWVNLHADFQRVFVAGDSAGGNIAHNVVVRAGVEAISGGVRILGMILFHPYFCNEKASELFEIIFPTSSGPDDPRLNPVGDPKLASLGCGGVLIFVAEKDPLRERGWNYYKALRKSGWAGKVEIVETQGENHIFHLRSPGCDTAVDLMKKTVSFLKQS